MKTFKPLDINLHISVLADPAVLTAVAKLSNIGVRFVVDEHIEETLGSTLAFGSVDDATNDAVLKTLGAMVRFESIAEEIPGLRVRHLNAPQKPAN